MKSPFLLSLFLCFISLSTMAQISTDGTLGQALNLEGPNFQIKADLGQQYGGNLFHSFQYFNLSHPESATFSGPENVSHVISRVTGGQASHIDGLIRSTMPNADMYFLNPNGIIFGPHARLDVQGSFHASTADYLRLGDQGRFDAKNPNDSLLTVAPIESFGFLDNPHGRLQVNGGGILTESETPRALLQVAEGKSLSLIGGPIDINNGRFFESITHDQQGNELTQMTSLPTLSAPSGQITLASLASSGELRLGDGFMEVSSLIEFADINMTEESVIAVNGEGGGQVFIHGQDVFLNNSVIEAKTLGDQDRALVDIQASKVSFSNKSQIDARTEGKGTRILVKIQAHESVHFSNGSSINMNTYDKNEGAGDAGSVLIKASNISFREDSGISNSTLGNGNAGEVLIRAGEQFSIEKKSSIYISPFSASTGGNGGRLLIKAGDVLVAEGSYLSGTTFGPGKGGDITILANGKVRLSEANTTGLVSGLFSNSNPSKAVANNAGNIVLKAKELVIEKGAMISSSTIAKPGKISSKGGNISLEIDGIIKIEGVNLYGENDEGFGSGIYVRAKGHDTGHAGNIEIEAKALSITDGGVIASTTNSEAQGGQIKINIQGNLSISGDSVGVVLREPAKSQIKFQNNFPDSSEALSISGIYGSSESTADNAGKAGNIIINANSIIFKENGFINTSTQNAGGGNITINSSNLLYSQKGQITTSVNGGTRNGGNITISNPRLFILNKGQIIAEAEAGRGGNIIMRTQQFLASNDSVISASSRLGIDGEVQIDSPMLDLEGMLVVLPGNYVEVQLRDCTIEDIEHPSTFKVDLTRQRTLPFGKFGQLK